MSVRFGSTEPSDARLAAGILILLAAVGTALIGFARLGTAIDVGQTGAPIVRSALAILGAAGGGIAVGVCLLIWEFSTRVARKTEKHRLRNAGHGKDPRA